MRTAALESWNEGRKSKACSLLMRSRREGRKGNL
eukprot:IDg3803t1